MEGRVFGFLIPASQLFDQFFCINISIKIYFDDINSFGKFIQVFDRDIIDTFIYSCSMFYSQFTCIVKYFNFCPGCFFSSNSNIHFINKRAWVDRCLYSL